jgi:two-component system nitrate/nitrite response regulator NarL
VRKRVAVMKIVLADDHRLVLDALEAYLVGLRPEIEILRASSFQEAEDFVSSNNDIDLVVLDLYMPGMSGMNGLRVMRDRYPDIPVVILSGQADGRLIREALQLNAAGFIPKDLGGRAMLSALELVLSGESYIPEAALTNFETSQARSRADAFPKDSPLQSLTAREFEVLTFLVKGFSNKEIAIELGSSNVTVAFHLKNVFKKLHVHRRTQAVSKALALGMQA